jgi:hypothetical protein
VASERSTIDELINQLRSCICSAMPEARPCAFCDAAETELRERVAKLETALEYIAGVSDQWHDHCESALAKEAPDAK